MTDIATLDAVARLLDAKLSPQYESTVLYPGYINVYVNDGIVWDIGTANGTWGGSLNIDGHSRDAFETTLLDDDTHSPQEIADAILAELAKREDFGSLITPDAALECARDILSGNVCECGHLKGEHHDVRRVDGDFTPCGYDDCDCEQLRPVAFEVTRETP